MELKLDSHETLTMLKQLPDQLRVLLFTAVAALLLPAAAFAGLDAQEVINKGAHSAGKLSGLPLDEEIPGRLVETREELIDILWKLFRHEYPEGRFAVLQEVMAKFGFYIDTPESDEELVKLFSEGIAGVYDPYEKRAYVVSKDAREEIEEEMRNRGCRLEKYDYGGWTGEYFLKNRELIVMVHEMTHAIQDQHFDLLYLEEKYKNNSDATFAYSALVEGMAEFIEEEFIYTQFGHSRRTFASRHYTLYEILDFIREGEETGNEYFDIERDICNEIRSYANLVSFLKYVYGHAFVEKAWHEIGWNEFEYLFENHPLSTEQILHPEKYFDEESVDLPTFIGYPDFYDTLPGDFEFVDSDSIGEYQIYLLIRDLEMEGDEAISVSEGWDGDRYYAFRHPDTDEIAFAWITVWDTDGDAEEFFGFYRQMAKRKALSASIDSEGGDLYYVESGLDSSSVERRENVVVLVEGISEREIADGLRELTFEAETYEATHEHEEILPDWLETDEGDNDEE